MFVATWLGDLARRLYRKAYDAFETPDVASGVFFASGFMNDRIPPIAAMLGFSVCEKRGARGPSNPSWQT
jgi:hypothetical protein